MTQHEKAKAFDDLMRTSRAYAAMWLREAITNSERNDSYFDREAQRYKAMSAIYVEVLQMAGEVCCICPFCREYIYHQGKPEDRS